MYSFSLYIYIYPSIYLSHFYLSHFGVSLCERPNLFSLDFHATATERWAKEESRKIWKAIKSNVGSQVRMEKYIIFYVVSHFVWLHLLVVPAGHFAFMFSPYSSSRFDLPHNGKVHTSSLIIYSSTRDLFQLKNLL